MKLFEVGLIICLLIVAFILGAIISPKAIPFPVITTTSTLDNLKTDCYVSGFIDGRGSILEEQSTTGYYSENLGMPEGYTSDRTDEWRNYADRVARGQSNKPTTMWFQIETQLLQPSTPQEISTILPDNATITGITWYGIREGTK